jgi:hypothetical protein
MKTCKIFNEICRQYKIYCRSLYANELLISDKYSRYNKIFDKACIIDDYKMINYFIDLKIKNWDDAMFNFAKLNNKDKVLYSIQCGAKNMDWGMYGAIFGKSEKLIEYFINHGARDWRLGLYAANCIGSVKLIKYFESRL